MVKKGSEICLKSLVFQAVGTGILLISVENPRSYYIFKVACFKVNVRHLKGQFSYFLKVCFLMQAVALRVITACRCVDS